MSLLSENNYNISFNNLKNIYILLYEYLFNKIYIFFKSLNEIYISDIGAWRRY